MGYEANKTKEHLKNTGHGDVAKAADGAIDGAGHGTGYGTYDWAWGGLSLRLRMELGWGRRLSGYGDGTGPKIQAGIAN